MGSGGKFTKIQVQEGKKRVGNGYKRFYTEGGLGFLLTFLPHSPGIPEGTKTGLFFSLRGASVSTTLFLSLPLPFYFKFACYPHHCIKTFKIVE